MNRYQLYVADNPGQNPSIRVYDSVLQRVLLTWNGAIAREILDAGFLPYCVRAAGCHGCDKNLVKELTMSAAAISMLLDRGQQDCRLRRRLEDLDLRLPASHHRVAATLFAYPDRHLGHEELICLLTLRDPAVYRGRVERELDDLVAWNVIQRITVSQDKVFYDINTSPHLHVFDAACDELRDAPTDGVIQVRRQQPCDRSRGSVPATSPLQ